MQVRLLTALVSPDGDWDEGAVYTCDDETARRLIASGQAVPFAVGGVVLAVGAAGPERAMKVRTRRPSKHV